MGVVLVGMLGEGEGGERGERRGGGGGWGEGVGGMVVGWEDGGRGRGDEVAWRDWLRLYERAGRGQIEN